MEESGQKNYLEELAEKTLALYIRDPEFFKNYGAVLKEGHFTPFDDVFYPVLFQIRKECNGVVTSDVFKLEAKKKFENLYSRVKDPDEKKQNVDFNYESCCSVIDRLFAVEIDSLYISGKISDLIREVSTAALLRKVLDNKTSKGEYQLSSHIKELREIAEFTIESSEEESKEVAINRCVESYPHDAIKGFVQRVADLYSKNLESPYPFWVFNTAVYLGNVMSPRVKLRTSLFPFPTMYVICLGESGDTKKSESGKQITKFFTKWHRNRKEYDKIDQLGKEPRDSRNSSLGIIHGIGSAEGLIGSLKVSPNSVIFFDELRSFVQKCLVQGSNLLQIINSLFDTTYAQNIVKSKIQEAMDVHLSIIGCCTIDTWNSMFSNTFLDIGFINRLWIVPGEGKKRDFIPPEISQYKKNFLYSKLNSILEFFPLNTTLKIDVDAYELLQDWYISCESSDHTKRLEAYGLRILMIMALSEKKYVIDSGMAKECIKLLDWQREVRKVYHPVESTSISSRIENLIRKTVRTYPRISRETLLRKIGSERFEVEKVERALKKLTDTAEIRATPGRGTIKFECID